MLKYNLHVTSVPDHKAQVVLARIIVGADSMIPLQQAIEMAAHPPLLLFQKLERKELEQHVEHLTGLGVKFDISEVEDESEDFDVNFGEHREAPEPPPEPKPPTPPPSKQLEHPAHAPQPHTPPHAAEHEYHKHHPGYRIGAPGEEAAMKAAAMREAEDASRKKSLMFTVVSVAVLLVIGVVMFSLPKGNKFTIERAPGLVTATSKQDKKSAQAKAQSGANAGQSAAAVSESDPTAGASAAPPAGEPRGQPTPAQRQRSNTLVDSARANDNDLMRNVMFYKTAISFNRQNLAAWQGLLQAYRELHKDAEAYETERQMKEIFGQETMSIGNIVKPYGELADTYVNVDGVQMVEYKTAKSSKVDILRDVFGITRAVRAACKCHNISVHVSTGSGKELTAHSTQHTSVHSLSEFMRQAEIVWLDE